MSAKIRGIYEYPAASGTYWIQFFAHGKRHREKVGKKSWAIKRLEIRKAEILLGKFFPARGGATVEQLVELTFDDYRINRQELEPIETCWKRLKPFFATRRADTLTTEEIREYLAKRSKEGFSNGSLNRDMALLKRSYRLASQMTPPKVAHVPVFPSRLKEAPARSGFIEDAQYRKLLAAAKEPWLKAFIAIAYHWGLRKQEILNLQVMQIEKRFIRLRPGETKSGEGRVVPLTRHLRELLEPCLEGKESADLVLTRGKRPVLDFRATWENVTNAAGVPGLLPHDFRRSAVRNMVNRGIPEKTAMQISGHLTRAVFDRYQIVSEADILEAGQKLEKPSATRTATGKNGRSRNRREFVLTLTKAKA